MPFLLCIYLCDVVSSHACCEPCTDRQSCFLCRAPTRYCCSGGHLSCQRLLVLRLVVLVLRLVDLPVMRCSVASVYQAMGSGQRRAAEIWAI